MCVWGGGGVGGGGGREITAVNLFTLRFRYQICCPLCMASSPTRAARGPLPADFTYSTASLARPLLVRELKRSLLPVHHTFGFDFGRRNNLHFVRDEVVASIVGNSVQLRGGLWLGTLQP